MAAIDEFVRRVRYRGLLIVLTVEAKIAQTCGIIVECADKCRKRAHWKSKESKEEVPFMAGERFEGNWSGSDTSVFDAGEAISCFREISGHRLTDDEVETLLAGGAVSFEAKARSGSNYVFVGYLGKDPDRGFAKVMLDYDATDRVPLDKQIVPFKWCEHVFSDEERSALKHGDRVHGTFHSKKSGNDFECDVAWVIDERNESRMCIKPLFDK